MFRIHFSGWFQCRLSTDPDPTDEPRGVSGFTFALAGEPDLDRIIRFHDPISPRSHGPKVGVFVRHVFLEGEELTRHPLVGGCVELLGKPKFEARNYILGGSGQGTIVPFHLRISGGGSMIEREDVLYPPDPGRALHKVPDHHLARRGPLVSLVQDYMRIFDATGIPDPLAYRKKRKGLLEDELTRTTEPVARAALHKRLAELSIEDRERLQVVSLSLYNDYRFDIHGPSAIEPGDGLGAQLDTTRDWPITFWMGAWDSDALCGFVRGELSIPVSGHEGDR